MQYTGLDCIPTFHLVKLILLQTCQCTITGIQVHHIQLKFLHWKMLVRHPNAASGRVLGAIIIINHFNSLLTFAFCY